MFKEIKPSLYDLITLLVDQFLAQCWLVYQQPGSVLRGQDHVKVHVQRFEEAGFRLAACPLITCRKRGVCNCCATSGAWMPVARVTFDASCKRRSILKRILSKLPSILTFIRRSGDTQVILRGKGRVLSSARARLLRNAVRSSHRTVEMMMMMMMKMMMMMIMVEMMMKIMKSALAIPVWIPKTWKLSCFVIGSAAYRLLYAAATHGTHSESMCSEIIPVPPQLVTVNLQTRALLWIVNGTWRCGW